MDSMSPSDPCEDVVFMCSSQTGKTEVLNNVCGYIMAHDPGPTLVVQPSTKPMGEAWSKDRLAPMIRDTPALHGKVKDSAKRDSGNTILHKEFPGGHLTVAGANSPAGLASRPIRYLLCDEIDRYEVTREGSPLRLAEKRTRTFFNRKRLKVSSPTYEDHGIDFEYKGCDQQYQWQLQCLHCDRYQFPQFRHFQFEERDSETVRYVCEHCGAVHDPEDEFKVKESGQYVCVKNDGIKSKGFWCNQWASPFVRWAETVDEFLSAKDDPEKLQTVINTAFAETWKEPGETIDNNKLLDRCEQYESEVPEGVLFLTFGADVQQDRIEVEVVGWGVGEESWSIDYQALPGDPTESMVWQDLSEYISGQFGDMRVGAGCVDSGYVPTEVYFWVQRQRNAHIWATKGMAGENRPFIEQRSSRAMRLRNKNQASYKPEILGVDEGKTVLYRKLKMEPGAPGSCHFPIGRDPEYFEQLAAEKRVTRYRKGFQVIEWIKERPRNEALDCRVLAHAALRLTLQINRMTLEQVAQKREKAKEQKEKPRPKRKRPRQSYVNNW